MKGIVKYTAEFKGIENRWLGMELEVNVDADADAIKAFDRVVSIVHAYASSNGISAPLVNMGAVVSEKIIQKEAGPTGDLENDILLCKDLITIDAYRFLLNTKQYEHLKPVYEKHRAYIVEQEAKGIIQRTNELTLDIETARGFRKNK